jgi:hypothetical protein
LRNFLAIATLDTLDVIAELRQRQPTLLRANRDLNRWREDLPVEDMPALLEWPAMVALLGQAKQAVMSGNELGKGLLTGQMARAMVSRLDPGTFILWRADDGPYHQRVGRFELALFTNPHALQFAQEEHTHDDTISRGEIRDSRSACFARTSTKLTFSRVPDADLVAIVAGDDYALRDVLMRKLAGED